MKGEWGKMSRVLIVEDEPMVLALLEDALTIAGHEVSAVRKLEEALALAEKLPIDAAVLDVNLAGGKIYPVADALLERKVPFLFITGALPGKDEIPQKLRRVSFMLKPFRLMDLNTAIMSMCSPDACPA